MWKNIVDRGRPQTAIWGMRLNMQTDTHFWSYLAQFFLQWEMFQTKVAQRIKKNILCPVTFFRKSYRLWDNVGKYYTAGQATDENMAHAHCMLDTWGYKHALRICNTAFPLQLWLHERASLLRYTYIVCIFLLVFCMHGCCHRATQSTLEVLSSRI
jgi:hypothetical protein